MPGVHAARRSVRREGADGSRSEDPEGGRTESETRSGRPSHTAFAISAAEHREAIHAAVRAEGKTVLHPRRGPAADSDGRRGLPSVLRIHAQLPPPLLEAAAGRQSRSAHGRRRRSARGRPPKHRHDAGAAGGRVEGDVPIARPSGHRRGLVREPVATRKFERGVASASVPALRGGAGTAVGGEHAVRALVLRFVDPRAVEVQIEAFARYP
mmetsp:Transcript_43191/g.90728  ORF Transcript_43191/g.90728 Transcript_43191/m.90728 type:complete len:211 (-) Transcript_43191:538-1170(-)